MIKQVVPFVAVMIGSLIVGVGQSYGEAANERGQIRPVGKVGVSRALVIRADGQQTVVYGQRNSALVVGGGKTEFLATHEESERRGVEAEVAPAPPAERRWWAERVDWRRVRLHRDHDTWKQVNNKVIIYPRTHNKVRLRYVQPYLNSRAFDCDRTVFFRSSYGKCFPTYRSHTSFGDRYCHRTRGSGLSIRIDF